VRRIVDGAGSPLAPHLRDAYRVNTADGMRQWAQDRAELARDTDDDALREVARAALEFLRDQPTGDGAAFQAWTRATDPFGQETPGVDVLTFHAAKGREWHTVFLLGCETSLVPHRSATTRADKAEEARLLYVALTRASDVLSVNWAERRGGYQRRFTPMLDGFSSESPEPSPPPAQLHALQRSERLLTLDRLREWRDEAARAGGILPDALCTDRTLASIADDRPSTPEELDASTGLGAMTARRLFPGVAAALAGDTVSR
jgi:DNA helicase-2/ATP-dependent DNA helicase PcrA